VLYGLEDEGVLDALSAFYSLRSCSALGVAVASAKRRALKRHLGCE
jgi:hypothetical protein